MGHGRDPRGDGEFGVVALNRMASLVYFEELSEPTAACAGTLRQPRYGGIAPQFHFGTGCSAGGCASGPEKYTASRVPHST